MILEQTIRDCVFVHFGMWKAFYPNPGELLKSRTEEELRRETISSAYEKIVAFLHGDSFEGWCDVLKINEDCYRQRAMKVIWEREAAEEAARTLEVPYKRRANAE